MAVTIRLTRLGKKHRPSYRIVVANKQKARDSRYIDLLGTYNPFDLKREVVVDEVKLKEWQAKGAQLTEGVRKLLKSKKARKSS